MSPVNGICILMYRVLFMTVENVWTCRLLSQLVKISSTSAMDKWDSTEVFIHVFFLKNEKYEVIY